MEYHRLDLPGQGVESFDGLAELSSECFLLINLQHNKLTDFEGFGTHPHLAELHLQHNAIHSFRGLTKQSALRLLNLRGCPVAAHPYYRIMALLTVGLGIEVVDGLPITAQERRVARTLGKHAALAVSYGWLLELHPRTADDYAALMDEHRRLRRSELRCRGGHAVVSVKSALADISGGLRARGYGGAAATELAEKERAITRLARRVAALEGQLAQSAEAHVVPLLPPNTLEASAARGPLTTSGGAFSAEVVAQVDAVSFARGIRLRHNLSGAQGELQRVCVQLTHDTLTIEAFMNREKLVQLPLRALQVRHLQPLTLVLEDGNGGALGLQFDSLPLLHAVYKALFVLSSRPVPPLSAVTQRQLQEIAQAQARARSTTVSSALSIKPAVPAAAAAAAAVTASSPARSVSEESLRVPSSPPEPQLDASSVAPAEQLSNVEDVPPLPAAFSRLSTAGGADSIVFCVDEMRESVRAAAAAQADSTVDFHSAAPSVLDGAAAAAPAPPAAATRSALFANLMVDSSASSESIVVEVNDDTSVRDTRAVADEPAPPPSAPPSTLKRAAPPSLPPGKAPLVPRAAPAAPPRPPPRKVAAAAPTPAAPVPERPPSVRSLDRSSLNFSVAQGSASARVAGADSISLRVGDSAAGESAAPASGPKADTLTGAPPRVPSRFSALRVDSDSDSD